MNSSPEARALVSAAVAWVQAVETRWAAEDRLLRAFWRGYRPGWTEPAIVVRRRADLNAADEVLTRSERRMEGMRLLDAHTFDPRAMVESYRHRAAEKPGRSWYAA